MMATELSWEKWAEKLIKEMPLYYIQVELPMFAVERILALTGWKPTTGKSGQILGVGVAGPPPFGELAVVVKEELEESDEVLGSE